MKKNEFVKRLAQNAEISQKKAKELVAIFWDTVIECVNEDEDGVIAGTGVKFNSEYHEPHMGRNPMTGEAIEIPGRYRMKAKFGAAIKNALND